MNHESMNHENMNHERHEKHEKNRQTLFVPFVVKKEKTTDEILCLM